MQRVREHRDAAIGIAGPFFLRAVPIEFHPVAVRVAQVKCFADAVVRGAFEGNSSLDEPPQGIGQRRPRGVEDGNMIVLVRLRREIRRPPQVACGQGAIGAPAPAVVGQSFRLGHLALAVGNLEAPPHSQIVKALWDGGGSCCA